MKYRLKQWYPSLPSQWKEREEIIVTNTYCDNPPNHEYARPEEFHKGHWYSLRKREVENNPEYWEPIEETYAVATESGFGYQEWTVFRTNKKFNQQDVFKYFETKGQAQQYVDEHKPKYSKRDIGKAITKTLNFNKHHIIDEFLDNLYE